MITPRESLGLFTVIALLVACGGDGTSPPGDASVTADATPSNSATPADGGASEMTIETVLRMCRTVHVCG